MLTMKQMRSAALHALEAYPDYRKEIVIYESRKARGHPAGPSWRKGEPADPKRELSPEPPPVVNARLWIEAIWRAYEMLRLSEPEKAELMARLYGLKYPINRSIPSRRRAIELGQALGVSEPTFYKWREDCVQAVVSMAIQAELLCPWENGSQYAFV